MIYNLFIDDLRDPEQGEPVVFDLVARSSEEAIALMKAHGCPEVVSFDHDLGGDDTSMRIVHWMINEDLDTGGSFITDRFCFLVHSANPVGSENLVRLLLRYLKEKRNGR